MLDASEPLRPAPFFMLRAPALSIATLDGVRKTFASGLDLLSNEVFSAPFVREALFLGSANLFSQLENPMRPSLDARLRLSFARYLYRMCTRCTPFGLFASISVGTVRDELCLAVSGEAVRHVRIDQSVLSAIRSKVLAVEAPFGPAEVALQVAVNSTGWSAPDGFRYVETIRRGDDPLYRLSRIEVSPALDWLINRLTDRLAPLGTLAVELAQQFDSDPADAEIFLAQLVQDQVLICEPQIAVTGDDVTDEFVAAIGQLPGRGGRAEPLVTARTVLREVGADSDHNIRVYRSTIEALSRSAVEIEPARAIQVDFFRSGPKSPEIPELIANDIAAHVWRLRPLLMDGPDPDLGSFADAFVERYGDASIPLLEALDPDLGIEFGTGGPPLTQLGREFSSLSSSPRTLLSKRETLLLRLTVEALRNGQQEIVLTDEHLAEIATETDDTPSSFTVVGSFGQAPDSGDPGGYLFELAGLANSHATAMFGRFACGDPDLAAQLRAFVADYEGDTDDTIIAEFAHLPDGRIGNVTVRPVLRQYEIEYAGRSGTTADRRIPVSDLYVNCENRRVGLFSRRLGRRIVPRVTNAHAHGLPTNLPIYRFLGALQSQGEPRADRIWGALGDMLPYLPPLRYGALRLNRRCWRFGAETTAAVARADPANLETLLPELFNGVRRVRVLDGRDNFLELDLAAALDRALFAEECRRNKMILVQEAPEIGDLSTDCDGRRFRHEIILPLVRSHPAARWEPVGRATPARTFHPPGRDWLYARLYCGYAVQDGLITELFPSFAEAASRLGCDRPFFVRYNKDGSHLRVRCQGFSEVVWTELRRELESLIQPLLEDRRISRLEYATYFPETRRYGGHSAMAACEHIFAVDSTAVSRMLPIVLAEADPDEARSRLALASLWRLLKVVGLEEDVESATLERGLAGYLSEFNLTRSGKDRLNELYRQSRPYVDTIVAGGRHPLLDVETALLERDEQIRPFVRTLRESLDLEALQYAVLSLMHMGANRILASDARLHELAVFHFLTKSRASLRGRERFRQKQREQLQGAQ